jgi:transposase
MSTVTVLRGPERRRRWSVSEKLRIVEECAAEGASIADVARRHDVHANLVHLWRRQARMGLLSDAVSTQFAPVAVAVPPTLAGAEAAAVCGNAIEVRLRNGQILRVPEGVAPARVAQLAEALEGNAR